MTEKLSLRRRAQYFYLPGLYQRDIKWALKTPYATAGNRLIIQSPNAAAIDINGTVFIIRSQVEIDVSVAAKWDTQTPTDYTVAANRAGKDFYIYACAPSSGEAPLILLSAASTYPSGYTASNSRKIGGFHCVCVAVGTISTHALTGFLAGDVLPFSIWDLNHKPKVANPEGMTYSEKANIWVDIYLASGTGASTASVNGGTISDTRDWMDFVDDGGAVKKRMLRDSEFQIIAANTNEKTNITGSSDPVTTGGHTDTASRRMISDIGCEDLAGVMYQWLLDQSFQADGNYTFSDYTLPGNKGSLYRQGAYGDVKLLAGRSWYNGALCGSRARSAATYRWSTNTIIGSRFCAEPV